MLVKNAPDEWPIPKGEFEWELFTEGALGLLIGFGLFLISAWLLAKHLPKLGAFAGLALIPSAAKKGDEFEASMTVSPEASDKKLIVGDIGEVVSKLRPAGRAKFGEAIVDVICEAEFIDNGTIVEIIEVHGNRVIVRAKLD